MVAPKVRITSTSRRIVAAAAPAIRKGRPTVDANDQRIDYGQLEEEVGAPTIMGVRQVRQDHPSYGIKPEQMALLMRGAETIDPSRFFSLMADIEERETHYSSVLSTRKNQVAQLPITVEAADVPDGEKHAQLVRDLVDSEEFALQLIDMLDGLGKGISWSEIVWAESEGQYTVAKILWRDPRWFRFDIADLTTGLLIDEGGVPKPLAPYKWVVHRPKLRSGIPIRNGLTRTAAYGWMFKNFAFKDWAIYLDVYGQPLRLGKYPTNATREEKRALLTAVSSLGSDSAAIIPAGMTIEFPGGASTAGTGGSPYKEMCTYIDEQSSKVVLGQTGTTDAVAGGSRGLGAVQNTVREDIERADSRQLSATINRDVVRPLVDLNYGPQDRYPRVRIGRPETKDVQQISEGVKTFVPMGLKVGQRQIREVLGLDEPDADDELLVAPAPVPGPPGKGGGASASGDRADGPDADSPEQDEQPDDGNADGPDKPASILAAAQVPGQPDAIDASVAALIADEGWLPELDGLQEALAKATTLEEAQAAIAAHLDSIGIDKLAELLAKLRFNARGEGVVTPTE